MFEYKSLSFQNASPQDQRFPSKNYIFWYNIALNKFKVSLFRGKIFRLRRRVLNHPQRLYDLHTLKRDLHLRESRYSGIQVVPIRSIIGSEGRTADFDMHFHPVSESARQRWVNVALAYLSDQPLEPVQLIQVGEAYFVRDGHHRISVGRAFGQVAVDAEVITWKSSSPFLWQPKTSKKRQVFSKPVISPLD